MGKSQFLEKVYKPAGFSEPEISFRFPDLIEDNLKLKCIFVSLSGRN